MPKHVTEPALNTALATKQDTIPTGTYVDTTSDESVDGIKDFAQFHVGGGRPWVDPRHKQGTGYGAVGDGVSRPLSTLYGSLAAAQAAFPGTTSLDEELDSAAFRRALLLSPHVRVDDGEFLINRSLAWATVAGSAFQPAPKLECAGRDETIFRNYVANGHLLDIDQGVGAGTTFGLGLLLAGFTIKPPAVSPPANSGGVRLQAQAWPGISDVTIEGLTGDGITIVNDAADTDATFELDVDNAYVRRNEGWGLNIIDSTSGISSGNFDFDGCHFNENGLGGARMQGLQWSFVHCAWINNRGAGGIYVPDVALNTSARGLVVRQCEFDRNVGSHINAEAIYGLSVDPSTKFIQGPIATPYGGGGAFSGPSVAIIIGAAAGSGVRQVVIDRPFIDMRLVAGTCTVFDVNASAVATQIIEPRFSGDTSFVTPTGPPLGLDDAGSQTFYLYDGVEYGDFKTRNYAPAKVAHVTQLAATQTADGWQLQASDGTVLARFTKDGHLLANGASADVGGLVLGGNGLAGFEFVNSTASTAILQLYNRTTGAYSFFQLNAVDIDLRPSGTSKLRVNGTGIGLHGATPVAKSTGWGAPTGTATKTTFDTTTVTTAQLAERVKALIDYLTLRGDIGA